MPALILSSLGRGQWSMVNLSQISRTRKTRGDAIIHCLAKLDNFAEPSLVLSFTLELQKTSSWRAGPSCFFRLKQQVTVSDQYVKTSTVN